MHMIVLHIKYNALYFWLIRFAAISYKDYWSLKRYKTRKNRPKNAPKSTWSRLWSPRYILENITKATTTVQMKIKNFLAPAPRKSLKSGSYRTTMPKEWPLGWPKSVGQNQSRIVIVPSNQKGLIYWYICLNKAMK